MVTADAYQLLSDMPLFFGLFQGNGLRTPPCNVSFFIKYSYIIELHFCRFSADELAGRGHKVPGPKRCDVQKKEEQSAANRIFG